MADEQLLLVVLTDSAKEQLGACDGLDEDALKEHLENLDNVRLFKQPDKKKPDEPVIALEVGDGRHALLCKQDTQGHGKGKNYLVCIAVIDTFITPDTTPEFCHELPSGITCQIIESQRYNRYQSAAVDCPEVCNEVLQKEFWRSDNEEERKWHTYLEMFDKIIKSKVVKFAIAVEKFASKKLTAVLNRDGDSSAADVGSMEQIKEARGEEVSFSLTDHQKTKTLGKLVSVNDNGKLEINLDKSFKESLLSFIKGEFMAQKDAAGGATGESVAVSVRLSESLPSGDVQAYTFYKDGKPSFKADAVLKVEETEDGQMMHAVIEESSVAPLRLDLSIDYFSDLYQIGVMKRRFEDTKKLPIWQVLSGKRVSDLPSDDEVVLDNPKLNEEQRKAIKGAVNAKELFLIWGPPGTGKTEVIKEMTKQAALKGEKILICSQSNLAVDNAIARIGENRETYPFRIAKDGYALEGEDVDNVPFKETSGLFFLKKLEGKLKSQADLSSLQKALLQGVEKSQGVYKKKRKSEGELREFLQHAKLYKKHINIVGTTLMIAGRQGPRPPKDSKQKRKIFIEEQTGIAKFDMVIIDEVSKATPPELFIPIPLAGKDGRLILVGDHKQLPPMFKMLSGDDETQEDWAKEAGIAESDLDIDSTIFERLWNRHVGAAAEAKAMLTTQYRMHPHIEKLIQPFYTDSEGQITCGLSHEEIKELDLDFPLYEKNGPCMWFGTKDNSTEERVGTSFINEDELQKVGGLLKQLSELKDKSLSVGVITFYGAQLRELRERYENKYKNQFGEGKLVFGTVDRFQGRECDVIICSLVRNNERRRIGFASKPNRINVALSRARKALFVLGSKRQFCYENSNKKAIELYKDISKKCSSIKPKDVPDEH